MARNAGQQKTSGWHAEQRERIQGDFTPERFAAQQTAWEKKLLELGVREDQAESLIMMRQGPGMRLRDFVMRIYARRFVPESVLETMGLHGEDCMTRGLALRDYGSGDE